MANDGDLSNKLSQKTILFGLKLWVLIGVVVGIFIVLILFFLSIWLMSRKKLKMLASEKLQSTTSIPKDSKEIKEVKVDKVVPSTGGGVILTITDSTGDGDPEKVLVRVGVSRKASSSGDNKRNSRGISKELVEKQSLLHEKDSYLIPHSSLSIEEQEARRSVPGDGGFHSIATSGELSGEEMHFGWGHWFTLRDLQIATEGFSNANVLGEGGYGIVYKGRLVNGTMVAVKSLLNNMGQAEREFHVEVEAIGRVRHKNLVRFLGYCMEGTHRMLVYEYVDNGNLEQWLHGSSHSLTWENRMRIIIGTAKALAYLHEALEPKVVHRDIKSSNILVDHQWNAKVSDFGLAKLLGAGKSHVTTRVMGTFGYVAPEYASTGLLSERNDVYSFGVLLLETITGRDPVDYARPSGEVNLVDWLKVMVGNRRSEEVVDPNLPEKPAPRLLKRVLLIALRCVDPDSEKRPKMGHVVHMLESDNFPYRDPRTLLS